MCPGGSRAIQCPGDLCLEARAVFALHIQVIDSGLSSHLVDYRDQFVWQFVSDELSASFHRFGVPGRVLSL